MPAAFSFPTAAGRAGGAPALTLALLLALALTGCSGATGAAASQAGPQTGLQTAPVIAPGRPGEPARTLDPRQAATAVPSPSLNAADVRYVQDMIVHHRQALDMAALAPSHADSPRIRAIAARIHDVQEPEIRMMTAWLDRERLPRPDQHADHSSHPGMTDMPGMATPAQLDALRAASGDRFDRLFLQLMIAHHEGAITMATRALTEGSHVTVQQWATDLIAEQTAEIGRMREML